MPQEQEPMAKAKFVPPTQAQLDAAIASLRVTGSRVKSIKAGHRHSVVSSADAALGLTKTQVSDEVRAAEVKKVTVKWGLSLPKRRTRRTAAE